MRNSLLLRKFCRCKAVEVCERGVLDECPDLEHRNNEGL